MSNQIFPSLPGLKWNQVKTPVFSTLVQTAVSGKESRLPLVVYPLYQFDLAYEILRDNTAHNELKALMGFYLEMKGAYDDFLYIDPSDNYAMNTYIGAGDGNTTDFQLIRPYGNSIEPVYDIQQANNTVPIVIRVDGNVQANNSYSISYLKSGILAFNAAPAANSYVTADLAYYYRVRFMEYKGDRTSPGGSSDGFSQFRKDMWEVRAVSFASVRPEGNSYFIEPPNAILINILLKGLTNDFYQGSYANDVAANAALGISGWGSNQLGNWWLISGGAPDGPHYKWWNGNEILIMG